MMNGLRPLAKAAVVSILFFGTLGCGDKAKDACQHGLALAQKEGGTAFTIEECMEEMKTMKTTLGSSYDDWVKCLLFAKSTKDAKESCKPDKYTSNE